MKSDVQKAPKAMPSYVLNKSSTKFTAKNSTQKYKNTADLIFKAT